MVFFEVFQQNEGIKVKQMRTRNLTSICQWASEDFYG